MPGERRCLARYALHHIAIAADDINVVVEQRKARPIELPREPAPGKRHADAVAAALPERTGRGLDARREVIFGMAGTLAAKLAKPFDVVERNRGLARPLVVRVDGLDAGEMEHGVKQHRGMAVGQHKTIAIRPNRIVGIEPQEVLPDRVDHRRQSHRRAGVAGLRLLDSVHCQGANRVDAQAIDTGGTRSTSSRNGLHRHISLRHLERWSRN